MPPAECPGLLPAIFCHLQLSLISHTTVIIICSIFNNHCPIINSWVWILSLPFQYLHHQGQNSNFWIHFLFSLWNFIFCDCYGWVRSRAQVPGQQLWPELCHYLPIFGFDRWDHGWTKVTCSRHQKQFPTKYDNHNLPNPYLIKNYLFRIPFLIKNSNLPAQFTHYITLHYITLLTWGDVLVIPRSRSLTISGGVNYPAGVVCYCCELWPSSLLTDMLTTCVPRSCLRRWQIKIKHSSASPSGALFNEAKLNIGAKESIGR